MKTDPWIIKVNIENHKTEQRMGEPKRRCSAFISHGSGGYLESIILFVRAGVDNMFYQRIRVLMNNNPTHLPRFLKSGPPEGPPEAN
jgi:hypothetical protein